MGKYFILSLLQFFLISQDIYLQNLWIPTAGPNGLSVASFVIRSDNVLVLSATNSGIYFSTDKGASWEKRSIGLYKQNSYATSLAAGPGGIIYAMIDNELYRMESNTNEWDKTIYKFPSGGEIVANPNGTIFIITGTFNRSIIISNDKGDSFHNLNNPSEFEAYSLNGNNNNYLVVDESTSYGVYRIHDDGTELKKIYGFKYSLTGMTWHPAGYLFLSNRIDGFKRMDSLGQNVKSLNSKVSGADLIALQPNGNLWAFNYDNEYESMDAGFTWTKKNSEIYKRLSINDQLFFDNDNVYIRTYTCSPNELSRTNDGGKSWISFNSHFANEMDHKLFIDQTGILFDIGCHEDNYFFSKDKGDHWQALNLPSEFETYFNLIPNANGELILAGYTNLYRSNDLGSSWNTFRISDDSMYMGLAGDYANFILVNGWSSNFCSIDGGINWNKDIDLPFTFGNYNFYIHPDRTNYAVGEGAFSALYFSYDYGVHWILSKEQFQSINAFHIAKDGTIYISGIKDLHNASGVFVSDDKFFSIKNPSRESFSQIITDNNGNLYGIPIFGLCKKSEDRGKTWSPFLSGLPTDGEASGLAIDKDQYLYIGLNNDVVYRTATPVIDPVSSDDYSSSNSIEIHPNPASDELSIVIYPKVHFPLSWQLHDIHGRSLLHGEIKSEKSTIKIESFPNGIYFLKFGDPSLPVKKIIINH